MRNGWIKLHRSLLDWEWYDDINAKILFLHCVLKANHSDKKWRGVTIKRGQFYTSLDTLSKELGLSVQKIRTAISKLESTGEITSKQHAKARMVTVINYDQHQADNKEITRNQQGSNKEVTTTKKNKNKKKEKNTKDVTNPASDNADDLEPHYVTRKGRKLTGKRLETFNRFWDAFDYRKDKSSAADSWLNIPSLTDSLVDEIVAQRRWRHQQEVQSLRTASLHSMPRAGLQLDDGRTNMSSKGKQQFIANQSANHLPRSTQKRKKRSTART